MRLVTRGDLDGLTSAVIITMKEPIDEIVLVHQALQSILQSLADDSRVLLKSVFIDYVKHCQSRCHAHGISPERIEVDALR